MASFLPLSRSLSVVLQHRSSEFAFLCNMSVHTDNRKAVATGSFLLAANSCRFRCAAAESVPLVVSLLGLLAEDCVAEVASSCCCRALIDRACCVQATAKAGSQQAKVRKSRMWELAHLLAFQAKERAARQSKGKEAFAGLGGVVARTLSGFVQLHLLSSHRFDLAALLFLA